MKKIIEIMETVRPIRTSRGEGRRSAASKKTTACLTSLLLMFGILFYVTGCAGGEDEFDAESEEVPDTSEESYGVFLGLDSESFDVGYFEDYDMVVVDAQELRKDQLAQLHAKGHTVYSYINVGSIEKSREYFKKYKDLCLDKYENWPDELWVDVTQEKWKTFVTSVLVEEIRKKDPNLDGFFLDNLDIYGHVTDKKKYSSMSEDVYDALVSILESYRETGLPVLINGADAFVSKLIDEDRSGLIYGVNQETVFSRIINYDKNKFGEQSDKEHKYYTNYLKQCKNEGLEVFVLEYTTDSEVENEISRYCQKNGFRYYISSRVDLNPSKD